MKIETDGRVSVQQRGGGEQKQTQGELCFTRRRTKEVLIAKSLLLTWNRLFVKSDERGFWICLVCIISARRSTSSIFHYSLEWRNKALFFPFFAEQCTHVRPLASFTWRSWLISARHASKVCKLPLCSSTRHNICATMSTRCWPSAHQGFKSTLNILYTKANDECGCSWLHGSPSGIISAMIIAHHLFPLNKGRAEPPY